MGQLFTIRFDREVFNAVIKVNVISIFGMIAITILSILFEGKLAVLIKDWNVIKVFLPQLELILMFLIPLFLGVFIRPLSRKRKHLIIQGSLILFISSLIYYAIVTYIPQLDMYPYDERGIVDNLVIVGAFIAINLAIYLPAIMKNETAS